jgi:hypothetical protein
VEFCGTVCVELCGAVCVELCGAVWNSVELCGMYSVECTLWNVLKMVKTCQSSNDWGGRRIRRSAVGKLVRMATARESAVSKTEEEEGHDFNVGDYVKILQDKKRERVNQIARVVANNPKYVVWVSD